MSDAEKYEAIGREVLRLWQRERQTVSELGRDVDKLLCWGPEEERQARAALYQKCTRCEATAEKLEPWQYTGGSARLCEACASFVRAAIEGRPVFARDRTESQRDRAPWHSLRGSPQRDHPREGLCECGLPWQLCSITCSIQIMCQAATRGEVYLAQLNAEFAWSLLNREESRA